MRAILLILLYFSIAFTYGQTRQVDTYNDSLLFAERSPFYIPIHNSSYSQANKTISIYLLPGEYIIYAGDSFSFGQNLEINFPNHINIRESTPKMVSFVTLERKTIAVLPQTNKEGLPSQHMLFSVYKKYAPYEQFAYTNQDYNSISNNTSSADKAFYKHSLFYFPSSGIVPENQWRALEKLASDFERTKCILMSSTNKQPRSGLAPSNWHIIEGQGMNDLAHFKVGGILSQPAVFIVDNETSKIVFHYWGSYKFDKVLRHALIKFQE